MSIPLVQEVTKDAINTSIIAIKKNLERINSLLGLVDSGSDIDTSEFVKKSDIVDVVQTDNMNPVTSNAVATSNAMPVDTVTSGNMHSVTSNAVANKMPKFIYKSLDVSYNGDYHYILYASDLGLTSFDNVLLSINASDWKLMADIQTVQSDRAIIRAWRIANTSGNSVALATDSRFGVLVFAIKFN